MLLPEYRDPNAGRPDLMSTAMSLAAMLLVIYGIKRLADSAAMAGDGNGRSAASRSSTRREDLSLEFGVERT